jgi:glycosyltransferase involved in cell wall biosynthesis
VKEEPGVIVRLPERDRRRDISKPSPFKQLYLAWLPFQRRQISMAPFFGFDTIFMPLGLAPRLLRPVQYLAHWMRTQGLLWRERPDVVWCQLPQTPLLSAAIWRRRWIDRRLRVVADCHNPMFAPPWSRWPGATRLLNRADLVLVHTEPAAEVARKLGVSPRLIRILSDAPAEISEAAVAPPVIGNRYVLFLTGFNPDEPIAQLQQAARLAPDILFCVTGDTRRAAGRHDLRASPPNMRFLGFLDAATLDVAIRSASVVLCLTKNDDEQSSSVAEAVGAGRPLVVSDTPVLRAMLPQGAIFVSTFDPASIAAGCHKALAHAARLEVECAALLRTWTRRWNTQAAPLRNHVRALAGRTGLSLGLSSPNRLGKSDGSGSLSDLATAP